MNLPPVPATPQTVGIAVTGRCNLRCRYCFYADEMVALDDLPTDDWLRFFDELGELGVMDVSLTGGEAFTRPDLFELIDGVTANRMRYNILSNGTLLDEAMLDHFEQGRRRLRLNFIQVSIDGASAEVHDLSRPASFTRAVQGLRLLRARGMPAVVRVTLNRHNFRELDRIAELLLDDIGLPSFATNDAMPMGSGCQNEPEIGLTAAQQLETMGTLERLEERYPGRITAQAGPQAKRLMFAEMEEARRTGSPTSRWEMGRLTSCGCVFRRIDVLHDGTIVPCHVLHGVKLGNIRTHSLAEIWRSHADLNAVRSRRLIPMHEVSGCEHCQWSPYCAGGCPGLAFDVTGRLDRANSHDCYRRFLAELGPTDDLHSQ